MIKMIKLAGTRVFCGKCDAVFMAIFDLGGSVD
jgi:hypothetical protein